MCINICSPWRVQGPEDDFICSFNMFFLCASGDTHVWLNFRIHITKLNRTWWLNNAVKIYLHNGILPDVLSQIEWNVPWKWSQEVRFLLLLWRTRIAGHAFTSLVLKLYAHTFLRDREIISTSFPYSSGLFPLFPFVSIVPKAYSPSTSYSAPFRVCFVIVSQVFIEFSRVTNCFPCTRGSYISF